MKIRVGVILIVFAVLTGTSVGRMPTENEFTNSVGMQMVRIEAGSFMMGQEQGGDFDERPVHEVTISKPFYMAATEVTNAQYEKFRSGYRKVSGKPDELSNGDDEAVVHVSW